MGGGVQETEYSMASFAKKAGTAAIPWGRAPVNWKRNGTGVTGSPYGKLCAALVYGETETQPTSSLGLAIITGSNVSLHVS